MIHNSKSSRFSVVATLVLAALLLAPHARSFSLLGPYEDWMDLTNGFRKLDDIGGPMDIRAAYRWNVPVVSYGFDQSFLNFFGSNGVAAVQAAIEVLNNLPPASALVLSNYPSSASFVNYAAEAQNLYDLKSAALAALVEHLGLAQPVRSMFLLRKWDPILNSFSGLGTGPPWPEGVVPDLILERNYDPQTLTTTNVVNGVIYGGFVSVLALGPNGIPTLADVMEYSVNPMVIPGYPIAEDFFSSSAPNASAAVGLFYAGLTYDDVGGLGYLLGTNNVNFETLLPDVQPAHTNQLIVNGAWRPGVDKITFVRHPFDAQLSSFASMTNDYTDTFFTNGQAFHQDLRRISSQPDFLFSAADNGVQKTWAPFVLRTGSNNWINNAALNSGTNQSGPGTIAPPVNLVFHRLGPWVVSSEPTPESNSGVINAHWGSFDSTTNAALVYPDWTSQTNQLLTVRLRLHSQGPNAISLGAFDWQVPVPMGGAARLLSSTNLVDWALVSTVTNSGGVIEWFHNGSSQAKRFFRVLPE